MNFSNFFASAGGAAKITLDANKDNTLYDDFEGSLSNGAGKHFFVGRDAGGNLKRGVIDEWNLSGTKARPNRI